MQSQPGEQCSYTKQTRERKVATCGVVLHLLPFGRTSVQKPLKVDSVVINVATSYTTKMGKLYTPEFCLRVRIMVHGSQCTSEKITPDVANVRRTACSRSSKGEQKAGLKSGSLNSLCGIVECVRSEARRRWGVRAGCLVEGSPTSVDCARPLPFLFRVYFPSFKSVIFRTQGANKKITALPLPDQKLSSPQRAPLSFSTSSTSCHTRRTHKQLR